MYGQKTMSKSDYKPTMNIVYGQPRILSTSFQTRSLGEALSTFFRITHCEVPSASNRRVQNLLRVVHNTVAPFRGAQSDCTLYCNDGVLDMRRVRGAKVLYWYDAHNDWRIKPPAITNYVEYLRFRNVLVCDHVFCVSSAQVELARCIRQSERNINYLPVGVDTRVFDPAAADGVTLRRKLGIPAGSLVVGYLGWIGRTGGRYAGQLLVEAAAALRYSKNLHYLVIGKGAGLQLFKEDVSRCGLSDRFTFTGYIPQKDLPSAIAAMDIAVDTLEVGFHSEARSETKLKQYLAMGRACVASDIGENRVDLHDGRCGVLCPPGASALADGIMHLAENPELRKQLFEKARKRAEGVYEWRILAEQMTSVLRAERG